MTHPSRLLISRFRRGFTLIEVLVTVGIIVLLTGLVLSGVLVAKKKATETRIRSDLALIGTALEAYKDGNYGQYPVLADPSTDYAVSNASPAIKGNGLWLDYSQARGAVLLCRALLGPGAASTNPNLTSGDTTAYPGDDGADGPGYRVRRIYNSGTGQFSGTVYGPYLDSSKFKIGYATPSSSYSTYTMAYPVIEDLNGNPILYYPAATGSPPTALSYADPSNATGTTPNTVSRFNGFDNQAYVDSTSQGTSFSATSAFATLAAQCGSPPYLLWTAGLDGKFGLDTNGKSDDITNFDLPANDKK